MQMLITKHILKRIVPTESKDNTKMMLRVLNKEPNDRNENEVHQLASYLGMVSHIPLLFQVQLLKR